MASALLKSPQARELLKKRRDVLLFYDRRTEDYDFLFKAQRGRCAICRTRPEDDRKLCIDHDHETGIVRGLLCDRCNLGLGHLEDWIGSALRYVIRSAPRAHKYGDLRRAQTEMKRIMGDARKASRSMAQILQLQKELEELGIGFSFQNIDVPGRLGRFSAHHMVEYTEALEEMDALIAAAHRTGEATTRLLTHVYHSMGIAYQEEGE